MRDLALVFLGGGCGSVARYAVTLAWGRTAIAFPLGTLTVNVLGCFLLGLGLALIQRSPVARGELLLLFGVGFCGGFTTFSTFAIEKYRLLASGNLGAAIAYLGLSVGGGLLAAVLGLRLGAR